MNPLLLLSSPARWIIVTLALLGGLYAAHRIDRWHAVQAEHDAIMGRWAAAELIRSEAAGKATEDARAEEQRRITAQQEITHVHELALAQAHADAAAANDAAARLRQRVSAILAAGRPAAGDPAAVLSSTPADEPSRMCAELLGRADERLRSLAAFADASHTAGLACQTSYNALTAAQ